MGAAERGFSGVPGQYRAFNSGRELVDTGKYGQLADLSLNRASSDHLVNLIKHLVNVGPVLALHGFGQERRRSFRNATSRPKKADVLDNLSLHDQKKFQLVAAKRIAPLGRAVGICELVKIARVLAMIQNDLLVEIGEIVEHLSMISASRRSEGWIRGDPKRPGPVLREQVHNEYAR